MKNVEKGECEEMSIRRSATHAVTRQVITCSSTSTSKPFYAMLVDAEDEARHRIEDENRRKKEEEEEKQRITVREVDNNHIDIDDGEEEGIECND